MIEFYVPLHYTHIALAILSPVFFSLRVARAVAGENPAQGWLRYVPHTVDALLFAAGVALAMVLRQYPFVSPWLTAKLLALFLYIVLGHVAVRRARSRSAKITTWLVSLAVLFYIYAVAITKNPLPGT
ncbi:MAG: SirB2 family protein [Gammaproteobacteria bacterium]|nr:SirB2 family protein [Gammaproteobacteria bacterium]